MGNRDSIIETLTALPLAMAAMARSPTRSSSRGALCSAVLRRFFAQMPNLGTKRAGGRENVHNPTLTCSTC
eukprot:14397977-Alexandrium_andersonii.AAC.1